MPIPKVKNKEKRSDYVSRCMSEIAKEYDNNKQAVAICYNSFKEAKAAAEGVVDLNGDEMLILKEKKKNMDDEDMDDEDMEDEEE